LIDRAIHKSGFSVVEVISPCVTYSSRWMGLTSPVEMMRWQKENCIHLDRAKELDEQERRGKIEIGIFTDKEKPTYSEEYEKFTG
jgi:2-oxoglutarate ferredoxin oxidoreductase subunit beta